MWLKEFVNKVDKYAVKYESVENHGKIGIKIYSKIGIWIYIVIYKKHKHKEQNYSCKVTTAVEIINKKHVKNELWKLTDLNKINEILIRPRFEFIILGKNKPKEIKNIKPDYSVKVDAIKAQIFIRQNDLFLCFPKYSYNLNYPVYFKLQNFKQLYSAVEFLVEKPQTILKMCLARYFWEITANAKEKAHNMTLDDYLTNISLLNFFDELIIKYGEKIKCQVQK